MGFFNVLRRTDEAFDAVLGFDERLIYLLGFLVVLAFV